MTTTVDIATPIAPSATTSPPPRVHTPPPPPPAAPAAAASRPVVIDVALAGGVLARHQSYASDLFGALRPYDLAAAPTVGGRADFYPGALATSGALADIGLTISGERAVGLAGSRDASGATYDTGAFAIAAGLRARVPVGRAVELNAAVQYGARVFSVAVPTGSANDAGVPDVDYRFVDLGVGARVALGERLAATAALAYRPLVSTGELAARYFPRATGFGLTAAVGVAFVLGAGFELRATGGVERYVLAMNSRPGDAYVAGGSLDQYFTGSIALAVRR